MESNRQIRVSVLAKYPLYRESLTSILETAGCAIAGAYETEADFLSRLAPDGAQVGVVDLEPEPALALLREVRRLESDTVMLVLSTGGGAHATEAYNEGAGGYLNKHFATSSEVAHTVAALGRGERVFPVQLFDSNVAAPTPKPTSSVLDTLSWRERQVLRYVAAGADNLKISALLDISERTVKAHVGRLYQKLGSENRTQLALLARQCGLRPAEGV